MPMAKPACVVTQTTTTHHMHICAYEVLCHGDDPPKLFRSLKRLAPLSGNVNRKYNESDKTCKNKENEGKTSRISWGLQENMQGVEPLPAKNAEN